MRNIFGAVFIKSNYLFIQKKYIVDSLLLSGTKKKDSWNKQSYFPSFEIETEFLFHSFRKES
jgi:hypothetical protein